MENLERFVESISIDNKLIKEADTDTLRESLSSMPQKLIENINKEKPQGWWVPISKFTKNGNGRIYGKKLWENVIKNQKNTWKGSPMLCDHPEGDGSPDKICGVWLSCKIDGDTVYGLLIPSGRLGEDLKEHLHNGLRVGTSSSGFGRLLPDGVTVDPDSYMIERLSDWVLNPSQGTFFSFDENSEENNHIINSSDGLRESISSSLEEERNNIYKENIVKDSAKIAKLEEKKFRRDMESFLEEATAIKDPQERLQEFREIRSYLEDGACPDLKEKIEQRIAEEEEYIKTAIREKAEFKEKFDVDSPKELEEKLTKIVEESSSFNKEAQDWKGVAEKLQSKLNEKNAELEERPTKQFVEYLNNKIESLEKQITDYKTKFVEFARKASEEAKALKESRDSYKKDLDSLNEEKKNLNEQLNSSQQNLAAANALSEKAISDKNKIEESFKALTVSYNNLKFNYDSSVVNMNESNKNSEETVKSLNEKIEALQAQVEDQYKDREVLSNIIDKQRENIEKHVNTELAMRETINKQKKMLQEMAKETRNAQFELYAKKTESKEKKVSNDPVKSYYETLYKTYGNSIIPFKEKILSSRTMVEAKNNFYQKVLPNLPESEEIERTRLPENSGLPYEERLEKIGMKESKENPINNILNRYQGWF